MFGKEAGNIGDVFGLGVIAEVNFRNFNGFPFCRVGSECAQRGFALLDSQLAIVHDRNLGFVQNLSRTFGSFPVGIHLSGDVGQFGIVGQAIYIFINIVRIVLESTYLGWNVSGLLNFKSGNITGRVGEGT